MNIQIGNRIKELRKKTGLSQERLARRIAMDRSFISKIESGKINLTMNTLSIICKGLNISLSEFFKSF